MTDRFRTNQYINLKTLTLMRKMKTLATSHFFESLRVRTFATCALMLMSASLAFAQSPVKGKVSDERGDPLIGASIQIQGTFTGTVTNHDGEFSIDASEGDILVIKNVGYAEKRVTVGAVRTIDIVLEDRLQMLDDIVVVGYGTVKKSDLTGSVASLKSDEITLGAAQSPDAALRGKSAGVFVSTVSGMPGAAPMVMIRGHSSITGSNEPLYVVDGIPLDGGGSSNAVKGVSVSPLAFINPSDIESMEILKDASSTAIYGSRGANGVIMITTKQGRDGRFMGKLDITSGIQTVAKRLDLTNAREWAELWNKHVDYNSLPQTAKYDLDNLPADTDWQDEIFRTASSRSYELSFSGDANKLRYMFSLGYTDQDGIIINTDFSRYALRANIDNEFSKWLTVGLNISGTRTEGNQVQQGATNTPVGMVAFASPIISVYKADGSYNQYANMDGNRANPYASLKEITNLDVRDRIIANVFAEITFFKDLKFRSNFAADLVDAKGYWYAPSIIDEGKTKQGDASLSSYSRLYWNSANFLTYTKTFDEIHNLTAMAGAEWQKSQNNNFTLNGAGFANDVAKFNNMAEANTYSGNSGFTGWQMTSYMARVNYSLMNRYLLTLTGRVDGSSRFGSNNKHAFLPSGAVAWRISEEDFMDNVDRVLSNLKLRVSYGVSGEQGIPIYQTLSFLNPGNVSIGGTTITSYTPNLPADPNLKWEMTNQFDAGIDIGLWYGRLNVTLDYYYKKTKDLLYPKAYPPSMGFSAMLQNIGSISNRGFEISVDASVINNADFKWDISANNSWNSNKVLDLGDGRMEILNPEGSVSDDKFSPSYLKVGEPLGLIYGYKTDGIISTDEDLALAIAQGQVNPKKGEYKIVNTSDPFNLDPDDKITTDDKTIIGRSTPDFTGGMTNTFRYKAFQLDVLCQWVVGNDIISYTYANNQNLHAGNNVRRDWYEDHWSEDNPTSKNPAPGYDVRKYADVSALVFKGSFFRINNIALSYNFPRRWISKAGLNQLRLTFDVDNAFTFTKFPGYTPDINVKGGNVVGQGIDLGAYPVPRTFGGKITIGF